MQQWDKSNTAFNDDTALIETFDMTKPLWKSVNPTILPS